jgi:hypothetical protein
MHFDRLYIYIDALDECDDWQRNDFLRIIASLLNDDYSVRVFATGKPHMKAQAERSFRLPPCTVTLLANSDDIRKYVARQLEMDNNYDEMDDSFKTDITERIVETADGMFVSLKLPPHFHKLISRVSGSYYLLSRFKPF